MRKSDSRDYVFYRITDIGTTKAHLKRWQVSGLLFVIGIELLKNNNDIKGIVVDGKEIKVTQFADDTTVFVNDHQSVINLLKVLTEFKHTSVVEIL